jgi:sterol 3beta-glucosyltransferase
MKETLQSDVGREWLESADKPSRYMKAFERAFKPPFPAFLEEVHAAVSDADALLFQPFAVAAQFTAEQRGIPALCLAPFPWAESAAFEPWLWPTAPRWPPLRRWLHRAVAKAIWAPFAEEYARHRNKLGLQPFRTGNPWMEILARLPTLLLFSPSLIPPPTDCGPDVHTTGYCFLDEPDAWTPPPGLRDFLAAGPPPVYVGFGSMTGRDPEDLAKVSIEAVSRAKQRAVLASGWSGMARGAKLPDHIFLVDRVPHSWLFPRVSAVIHHGGAGTTAAGLRAGKPTLVAAFFGDQPLWGRRVSQAGAGPMPILRKRVDATTLAEGIARLVGDETYRQGAARVAEALRREDGVANAVKCVERYVRGGLAVAESSQGASVA